MKILDFLIKHKKPVVIVSVLLIVAIFGVHTVLSDGQLSAGDSVIVTATTSNINPDYREATENGAIAVSPNTTGTQASSAAAATEVTEAQSSAAPSVAVSSAAATSAAQATTQEVVPFATAITPEVPADYGEQWDLGYLIAIDNPDKSYACSQVTLTEEDRDLLERLCMGEFGSGGFLGASLIAQAVKNAMCFDGYTSVAQVIRECRYTGSTDIGTNDACRQAVRYIFDDNHDAVQHRIMYMYNPYMVQSAFHESQNFILSYGGVRFFDRWGY